MSECPNPNAISQWIPVVGTLLGAIIGFLGGLLNSQLTHKNRENAEKESRERNRLENLYETLIVIRMDYQSMLGQMMSKVHFNTPVEPKQHSGIPPLIKLDMVIHMYFPNLVEGHKKFTSAAEPFGAKLAENITTSFSSHLREDRLKICGEYTRLFKAIDDEITNLQHHLTAMAKP